MQNYAVYDDQLSNMPSNRQLLITTINQYSFCMAEKDLKFKTALEASDILLPDGVAITKAIQFLTGKNIKKIAGADVHDHLLNELNEKKGRCFYLGSSESTLEKIRTRINIDYPNIIIKTFSPPFKKQFTPFEDQLMIEEINKFSPDVLFIGMTAPKQEKWAHQYKEKLDAQVICCIGAVFDFYAGTVNRPSDVWINSGMEWLGRLIKEPKRMWKRYLYYGPIFLWHIAKPKEYKRQSKPTR
jgi:N-acetylglucosaminyldiphosphoundecaprenol N-acetyl-beta-D-mannosaminyltransferase